MFSRSKRLVGVDIGSSAIKAVMLTKSKKGYELEKISLEPVGPQVIVDGDIIDSVAVVDVLDRLFHGLKLRTNDVAISISGNSVIIKRITLPSMSEEEMADSILWEAEQYIPFEIDDVMVDFEILNSNRESDDMDVVLVAVKKDKVNDYTSVISQVGKQTALVDVDLFAIQNCFEVNYPDLVNESIGLVNVGASVTSINIIESGVTSFWRDIMIGGNVHTELLQRKLGLDAEQAEEAKKDFNIEGISPDAIIPLLDEGSHEIADVISKTFEFYHGGANMPNLDHVFICGGAAATVGFQESLKDKLGMEVEMLDPFRSVKINSKKFDAEYIRNQASDFAVAMGLSVREVEA